MKEKMPSPFLTAVVSATEPTYAGQKRRLHEAFDAIGADIRHNEAFLSATGKIMGGMFSTLAGTMVGYVGSGGLPMLVRKLNTYPGEDRLPNIVEHIKEDIDEIRGKKTSA